MRQKLGRLFHSDNGTLFLICLAFIGCHFLNNGLYGFHRDELVTLDDARHMEWGFVAYPPLTPAVARIELDLFGTSLFGFRVLPTFALAIAVFMSGLIARELGGGRRSQLLTAITVAVIPIVSIQTNVLQYVSFDYLWCVLLTYFVIRLINTDDPRWWVPIGAAIGLGMMTKYTMGFFVIGLAAGVLLTSARRRLLNRWLFLGIAVSLLIFLPNFLWQLHHDFISLDFLRHIHARDIRWGRTKGFIPEQLFVCVNLFTLPLVLLGLWYYFTTEGRKYRLFGWMYLATFVLFVIAQARSYYLGPLYPILIAAGSVVWERWIVTSSRIASLAVQGVTWLLVLVAAVTSFAFFTPAAQINSPLWHAVAKMHENYTEEIGWPELTKTVADIYASIPAEERSRTGIIVGNYGEAGAINLYGPAYGLPPVISGTNSLWYRTYPQSEPQTLIVLGFDDDELKELFQTCQLAGHNSKPYGVRNEESRDHPDIYLCHNLRPSWRDFWKEFRRYG
jgi:4-amino-4-deoxy-L-arabinose transferase-like glycosyltransferase